jgi:hypothetical protein
MKTFLPKVSLHETATRFRLIAIYHEFHLTVEIDSPEQTHRSIEAPRSSRALGASPRGRQFKNLAGPETCSPIKCFRGPIEWAQCPESNPPWVSLTRTLHKPGHCRAKFGSPHGVSGSCLYLGRKRFRGDGKSTLYWGTTSKMPSEQTKRIVSPNYRPKQRPCHLRIAMWSCCR